MGTISEEQVQTAAEAVGSYFPLVAACVASTAGTSNPEMVSQNAPRLRNSGSVNILIIYAFFPVGL